MTPQEIFDKAVIGIIRQGMPSIDADIECLYRGPRGLKCAVGQIIPDDLYDVAFEGRGPDHLALHPLWKKMKIDRDGIKLLEDLQSAHDDAAETADFIGAFTLSATQIATDRGLTMPSEVPA